MRVLLLTLACLSAVPVLAQDVGQPRDFSEFRGRWVLDEKATEGLRVVTNRLGQPVVYDHAGLAIARSLVIAGTDAEITVARDGDLPETYRFDGSESQTRDPRTGAYFTTRYSFLLVANIVALTTRRPTAADASGFSTSEMITEALSLPEAGLLRIERQVSYLHHPPGQLWHRPGLPGAPHTLFYRRATEPLP
jgi:hypothetical protein